MATLADYVKGLREQQKPQPSPDPETDLTVNDTLGMLNELGVETNDN